MNSRLIRILHWAPYLVFLALASCLPTSDRDEKIDQWHEDNLEQQQLTIPTLQDVSDTDETIRIVTTTGIIADVASAIAGEDAEVVALMAPNQDPHGYQITSAELKLVANADAVFVNGWQLEEGMIGDLENSADDIPLVPVSAGVEPRAVGSIGLTTDSHNVDPHVWLSPLNVVQWVDNIELVLSSLDRANASSYAQRAQDYRSRLVELDVYFREQLDTIDIGSRVLVTNHDAFGYFADAYGFRVVGTIIPGDSSVAEPSSRDLATLVQRMREASACAIFVEHSASQRVATQLADDLEHCDPLQIVTLYSGALGDPGSGAETYLTMMKANVDRIAEALGTATSGSNAD